MSRTRFLRTALRLSLVLALGVTLLFAQKKEDDKTRGVSGVVIDAKDTPVAKAVVQLRDTKTRQIRSFISTDDGAYRFFGLNPNIDYELSASKDGVGKSETRMLSSFDSRKNAVINLKLDQQ